MITERKNKNGIFIWIFTNYNLYFINNFSNYRHNIKCKVHKVEKVVDDVNEKVKTLNGFFHVIDYTTDKIALATDKVVEGISGLFNKLLFSKNKKKIEKDDNNE